MWTTILGGLSKLFSVIVSTFEWIGRKEQREHGRLQARLKAAEREAKRGKERGDINADVRDLDSDALERELRNHNRDR